MKLLIVALFVTALANIGAQEVAPEAHPSSATEGGGVGKLDGEQKTRKAQNPDAASSPILPCIQCLNCCPVEQPYAQSEEEKAKTASLDRLYRYYMWATIIGVCGGFIGLVLILWQNILTRRSANAARDSAKAQMTSERAWIVIACPMSDFKLQKEGWDDARYAFHVQNVGKTPARIIEVGAVFEMLDALSELPETMHVQAWPNALGRKAVIVPNETLPMVTRYKPDAKIGFTDMGRVKARKKFLFAYGYVLYLDAFDRTHETRFVHFYNVPVEDDRLGWEGFAPYAGAPDDYYRNT